MVQEVDQRAAAGDVAAERADRLRQRADLDVDAAVHAEVIDGAAAVPAEHAAGVRVVDHHDAAELLGERRRAPGSGPRSPSMLKTPSVMSSLRCAAGSSREDRARGVDVLVREDLDGRRGSSGSRR